MRNIDNIPKSMVDSIRIHTIYSEEDFHLVSKYYLQLIKIENPTIDQEEEMHETEKLLDRIDAYLDANSEN